MDHETKTAAFRAMKASIGLTAEDLAPLLGISAGYFRNIAGGSHPPCRRVMDAMIRVTQLIDVQARQYVEAALAKPEPYWAIPARIDRVAAGRAYARLDPDIRERLTISDHSK